MAMLWETATGQPAHSPSSSCDCKRYLFSACGPNLFFFLSIPPSSPPLSLCLSNTCIHFVLLSSGYILFSPATSFRYETAFRASLNLAPRLPKVSRDASLSTSRFNCLSMPDDAFSARAIPSERPRERHRFFRKRIRPRLIIDSHSPALDCPEKRNVPVVETPFTDEYVPARTRSLCSLARNIFHATRVQ